MPRAPVAAQRHTPIAIPTAIVGAGFVEEMRRKETHEPTRCPHCGKKIL